MNFKRALTLAVVLSAICSVANAQGSPPLYQLVNPMIGIGNDKQGDTIPGPALPNGSIHPSPDTLMGSNAGYDPAAQISGFAQLHTQGSGGVTTYGTFLVSPQTGSPEFNEPNHLSPKFAEQAAADMYSVVLRRYNIKVDVTPAHYAAIYRLTYPDTDRAQLVFDITRKILGVTASDSAEVKLYPHEGKIIGRVRTKGYWTPTLIDIWFCAKLSQEPAAWGVFDNGVTRPGETSGKSGINQRLGAWWTFDAKASEPVFLKIAVSFTSSQQAQTLLDQDIPGWNFEGVRKVAQEDWDKELGRIEVSGVPQADLTRFYTALYHTSIQPRDRSLDQGEGEVGTDHWDDYYTLWDTYRTEFPLMSLIKPGEYAGNINSIIQTFNKFGEADTAFIGGRNYHVGQGGDEVDNIIGEALLRGVDGIDWNDAYRVTHFDAFELRRPRYLINGYSAVGDHSPEPDTPRARSGSSTVAFALNDYYAAKVAAKAGHADEASLLYLRSRNWRNVWNPSAGSDGYAGFIMPRYADGTFENIDPKLGWDGNKYNNVGFYEGTAWIYSYGMLHDVPCMVQAMGGRAHFIERLQHALSTGLIDITNEPSFSTPWLFTDVGRPDLTGYWANEVYKRFTATAYPGDEDNGAMSSHYVFNSLGLFPKLGSDLYYLHGPHQPLSIIHLESGKTFEIVAHGAARGHIYIQKAFLNGSPLKAPYIRQSDIASGGKLEFFMGRSPSRWARGASQDLTETCCVPGDAQPSASDCR
jgi:predicted alpha-1,2-mannosidase